MGVFVTGRQVVLEIPMPGWWFSGASVDLDFDSGRFYDSSTPNPRAATDFLSITRASIGYAKTSTGIWTSFGTNTLRMTDLGLLIEDARTNLFLNSQAPATQTITVANGTTYTVSVYGTASVVLSGAGTGTATQGSDVTFTASTTSLTCTVSGAGGAFQNVNVEAGSISSSPIVTTGTSATRAADAITLIGNANTILSGLPFSIVADLIVNMSTSDLAANPNYHILGNGNAPLILNSDTRVWSYMNGFFATSATLGNSRTFSGGVKVAVAAAAGASSLVGGGGTVVNDTVAQGQANLNLSDSSFAKINGYRRRLTIWNTKLADATLQGLTFP